MQKAIKFSVRPSEEFKRLSTEIAQSRKFVADVSFNNWNASKNWAYEIKKSQKYSKKSSMRFNTYWLLYTFATEKGEWTSSMQKSTIITLQLTFYF